MTLADGSPIWAAKTGQRVSGISGRGECAVAQERSGRNSLDWAAHVFMGLIAGGRVVHRPRCHSSLLDC